MAAPTLVVEREEDLAQVDFTRPVYFLSQTTQSIALFERLADEMRRRAADASQVVVHDTICRQVANREGHLAAFARRFDAVIFVSGRKSSNGKVLCEVCRAANARTYQVEEAAELRAEWFEGAESVGICGATVDAPLADAAGGRRDRRGGVQHRPYLSAGLHRRIACGGFREGFQPNNRSICIASFVP